EADTPDSSHVVIVNETLAKRFWPDSDALGKHIRLAGSRWEVVGVVGDVKRQLLRPITPDFYVPLAQHTGETMTLVARTRAQPLPLTAPTASELHAIHP